MSFFENIKRSLGFGGDSYDEDDPLYEDTTLSLESDGSSAAMTSAPIAPEPPKPAEFSRQMQEAIFTKVVEVFNASLPDFLAKSVDPDRERQNLLDALDSGVKDYIDNISRQATEYCEAQWKARQANMAAELEALKAKAGEIEKQSSEVKQRQLSADRQKRALSDRVHDLEATVAKLESEREQYELENRSLVNRIKVANVQQEDLEKAQADLQALQLEFNKLRQDPQGALSAQLAELEKQKSDAEDAKKIIAAKAAEMEIGIDSLKEQLRVANEMLDDQRKRLAEAESYSASAKTDAEAKDKEIGELKHTIAEYEEVMSRLGELDTTLTRQQDKIKSQKKAIAERDSQIEALKATITENLRLQAEREKQLQNEIQALRPPTVVAEMQVDFGAVSEENAPIISEDDLSAMEETFESGDWYTKAPPAQTPSMRPTEAEAEFGYHAPRRKNSPTNHPDQLSLF